VSNQPILDADYSIASLAINSATVLNLNTFTLNVSGISTITSATVSSGKLITGSFTSTSSSFSCVLVASGTTIVTNSSTYTNNVSLTYVGTTNANSGGNTFSAPTRINQLGSGYLSFGVTNPDVFQDSLFAIVNGSKPLLFATSSTENRFEGYTFLQRDVSATSQGIIIGSSSSSTSFLGNVQLLSLSGTGTNITTVVEFNTCMFETSSALSIHSSGFNLGQLSFISSRVKSAASLSLTGNSSVLINNMAQFDAALSISASNVFLNSCLFNGLTTIEKTGGGTNQSFGPITANSSIHFKNSNSGLFYLEGYFGDQYGNVTLENTGTGHLAFCRRSANNVVNGTIQTIVSAGIISLGIGAANNLSLTGNISINSTGGRLYLGGLTQQSGGTISNTNLSGDLFFNNFNQLSTAPINLLSTGSSNRITLNQGSSFTGVFKAQFPSIITNGGIFADSLILTKTGALVDQGNGGLICNGPVIFDGNHSDKLWQLNYAGPTNYFNDDVYLNRFGAGQIDFGYAGEHQFNKDLYFNGTNGIGNTNNYMTFNGQGNQYIRSTNSINTVLSRIAVNKPSGDLLIESKVNLWLNLNLQKGNIISTNASEFVLGASCTITGGSDSSHVEGPILRAGTTAFTFPLGGQGMYAPLTLDAVATATTYKVEYIAQDPDSLYSRASKDTTIGFVNRCGYWKVDRTSGSQNTTPSLGWSNNSCYNTSPIDASIALWDGSTWKNKGNAAYSGTSTAGVVKSMTLLTSFPAILNLGGVCSFVPELTTNLDTLIDGYLGFVQASPLNQPNYKFFKNGVQVQNSALNYYSSSSLNNSDSISVIVTNMNGCDGSSSINIIESSYQPYKPVTELVFDWAGFDGAQEYFLSYKSLVKTDAAGNVYKAGSTLQENGDYDILVCKYDSNGVNLWCKQYAGASGGNDIVSDIELDSNGSLFLCGSSVETSADSNDVIILKYLANGDLAWSTHFNGSGNGFDAGIDLSINEITNKISVSAITTGLVAPLTDFLTLQLDINGSILWQKVYDNGLFDVVIGHLTTPGDTVTVSGVSQVGLTEFSLLSVQYNPSGDTISTFIAADNINFQNLRDVKFASNGNIYLTGSSPLSATGRDIQTVALNSNLSLLWSAVYNSASNFNDEGRALTFDNAGNVYVAGYSQSADNGTDARLLKYTNTGSLAWARSFNGEGSGDDTANAIVVDHLGLVSIAGSSFNSAIDDYFVLQYDTLGTLLYQKTWNSWSNKNDRATALAIDNAGAVVISGQSETDSTMNYSTVRYMKKELHETGATAQNSSSGGFIENRGQLLNTNSQSETEVLYYNQFMYPSTYFKTDTVSLVFSKMYSGASGNAMDSLQRIDMTLVNGSSYTRFEPRGNNKSMTNFYYPHIQKGRERVPSCNSLYKANAWHNIDVEYASNQEGLVINFIVTPGGRTSNIKVKFIGQDSIFINTNQELVIKSILGQKDFSVASAYTLYPNGQKSALPWKPAYTINSDELSFTNIGTYESDLPLVIEVKKQSAQQLLVEEGNLWWSTYYGGNEGNEITMDVATDGLNNSYLCGRTNAADFPKTNTLTVDHEGDFDAFLVQFNSFAVRTWATLYGGSAYDSNDGITINKYDSNASHGYTIGTTESEDLEAFNTLGSNVYFKGTNSGEKDAFITNFRLDVGTLLWSSFIGGEGEDIASGITYDNFGNIYGLINTKSQDASENSCGATITNALPLCNPGAGAYFEDQNQGDNDLFIIQFNPSKQLTWSTYFGSNEYDFGFDIHANNNPSGGLRDIYIVGKTNKTSTTFGNSSSTLTSAPANGDFPLFDSPSSDDFFQPGSNAFISRFKTDGKLVWSTNITGASSLHSLATTTDNYVIAVGIGGPNQAYACLAADAGDDLPICDLQGPVLLDGNEGFIAKFFSRNELKWSTSFNAGLEYCGSFFENEFYVQEFPYIADLCPTISRKLDVTTMDNNSFFVIASNNYKNFNPLFNPSLDLYFDSDYFIPNNPTGLNDPNRAYADAIIMGYYPNNTRFFATYFGSPAFGVMNNTFSAPNWIDIGQAIACHGNDVLYIAGHSSSRGNFPWQLPEVDPNDGEPWYQTFGGFEINNNLNSFIARFNFDEFNWINSIENNENSKADLVVYPNPTNGIFTIDFTEAFTGSFAIYNYLGQQVQQVQSQKKIQKYQFDLNGESSGIYFLLVYSETEANSKAYKIIKR